MGDDNDNDKDKDDDNNNGMIRFLGAVFTVWCRWERVAAAFREESIHLLRKPHHLHSSSS